ncbi:MAG: response regulator transcription factor [bacterium]|nr:MAG: response regulator transcription factor [bacterium]
MKVLIVDDNPKIRRFIRSIIQTQVADVDNIIECDKGMDAIEIYDQIIPDWVFMDIAMQPMNGFETSQNIFQNHPDAKIVFVTQYDEYAYREEAKKIGARAFILKENLLDLPGLMRSLL